ncbi:MAG TPA: response regulator, partial [Gammaproteobacteria bacterium]|nr:response regulator [Gammaproteobacteria bacterium]
RAGHRVTLMRDGEAALQAALGCDFDLAIVDLRMPRMDGLDFTRAWREHEAHSGSRRRMPIVALTANVAEEARDACLEAGMDDFLTKPVDPDTLDELIARLAGGRY